MTPEQFTAVMGELRSLRSEITVLRKEIEDLRRKGGK